MPVGIGDLNEMQRFVENYPVFMDKLPALDTVRDKVFERKGEGTLFDIAIFAFGRVCAEDFQQVFVLCGNGYGIGALQIVRGMYERHVTAVYLLKYPDELDKFLAYDKVQKHKGLFHFARSYTPDELDKMIPKEAQAKIREEYESVKKDFRGMRSWTTLSTLELAIKGERGLDKYYYHDYFEPTLMSHSSASSLSARIRGDENGYPFFDAEGQRKKVRAALMAAHRLLLFVLDLQNEYFKSGLDDDLKQLTKDFTDCWDTNEGHPGQAVKVPLVGDT